MDSSTYLDGKEIRLEEQIQASCLNFRNELSNNEVTQRALDSTAVGVPTEWVAFKPLPPGEVRVDWVAPRTPGSVHIRRPGHKRTSIIPAGSLVAANAGLKVGKGYKRQLTWRVDETPTGKQFILHLVEQEVVPTKKRVTKAAQASKPSETVATEPTKA